MNWLDILIVVAVGTSVAIGVLRGFVRECFSLAAYVVGYLVATGTYVFVAELFTGIIRSPQLREILSFAVIFIIAVVLTNLLGRYLRKLIAKAKGLSLADRVVGLTFGFCRGVLILALVMIPLSLFPALGSDSIRGSSLAPYLMMVSRELSRWAFSEDNVLKSDKIKIRVDTFSETVGGGVNTLKKAAEDAKDKVSEKIGENILAPSTEKDGEKREKTGITQEDRKQLNQLIEQL